MLTGSSSWVCKSTSGPISTRAKPFVKAVEDKVLLLTAREGCAADKTVGIPIWALEGNPFGIAACHTNDGGRADNEAPLDLRKEG